MPVDRQRMVNCPRCGTPTPLSATNPYRPFCSERCKLVDLGQWASESYRIPLEQDESERKGEPE